jgi:prefoldin alpha subunit
MSKSTKKKELNEEEKKELYFELKQLDEEVKKLNTHLENVDDQLAELNSSIDIINKFSELKKGEELRVPITSGIYIKSELTDTTNLMINVGSGVTVEKTPIEVTKILNSQVTELNKYRADITSQMTVIIKRIEEIQKVFE